MKIPINLASVPFRRDRPMLIASTLVGLTLAGLLGVLISLAVSDRGRSKDTRRNIAQLERQLSAIAAEQSKLESVLRKPENAEVLERSLFLNSLLYRKGISWTKIFADLEKTLPHNVRLISIRPEVTPQNQIRLDMNLAAESMEPVIEALKRLEASDVFGGTLTHSGLPPTQTDPLYRYRVSVNYAQRL